MSRVLISGASGQDGFYLTDVCVREVDQVWAILHGQSSPRHDLFRETFPMCTTLNGDVTDYGFMAYALGESKPDHVFNLAGISFVPYSWHNPWLTSNVNGVAVAGILHSIDTQQKLQDRQIRLFQASTSEMLGGTDGLVSDESSRLHPRSPYAAAKALAHYSVSAYREGRGLHASCGIMFNHESPLRGVEFVTRKIISFAVSRRLTGTGALKIGNVSASRDWGFAGDYVKSMRAILAQNEPGDYVLATQESHTVEELLELVFTSLQLGNWYDYTIQSSDLFRPGEVQWLCGSAEKARNILGWAPELSFHDLVDLMIRSEYDWQKGGCQGIPNMWPSRTKN